MADIVTLPAKDIVSPSVLTTSLPDGQWMLVLTGVLVPVLKGGPDWVHRTLRAAIPIGQNFTAKQWAPFVALASVDSDAPTSNPGWAVDGFSIANAGATADNVLLDVDTAVRDPSNFLLRLSYSITLVGSFS